MKKRQQQDILPSSTHYIRTGCGSMSITICWDGRGEERGIKDIFIALGKNGTCAFAQTQSISKLLTAAAKHKMDLRSLAMDMINIRCNQALDQTAESCGDAIGKFLLQFLEKDPWGTSKNAA